MGLYHKTWLCERLASPRVVIIWIGIMLVCRISNSHWSRCGFDASLCCSSSFVCVFVCLCWHSGSVFSERYVEMACKYLCGNGVSHRFLIGPWWLKQWSGMQKNKQVPCTWPFFVLLFGSDLRICNFRSCRCRRFHFSKDPCYMAVPPSACMCSMACQHTLAKGIPKPGWFGSISGLSSKHFVILHTYTP